MSHNNTDVDDLPKVMPRKPQTEFSACVWSGGGESGIVTSIIDNMYINSVESRRGGERCQGSAEKSQYQKIVSNCRYATVHV